MDETQESEVKTIKEEITPFSQRDITQLIEKCGFGPFQCWFYTFLFATRLFTVMSAMSLAFITANVPFVCYPPNYDTSAIPAAFTENEYLQLFQPEDDHCSLYNNTLTEIFRSTSTVNLSKIPCSYGRKFLTENFSTVVSEFDLVCGKKWLKSTLQSVYFVGYLIGSIIFGVLSDRFGRKLTFFMSNTFFAVCGISKIFMPSSIAFMIFHCMQASGFMGISISTYALNLEFAPSRYRTPLSFVHMSMYTFTSMLLPAFAYAIPNWHYLELTVCLLPLANCFLWNCLLESPRWLIGRKRFRETKELLEKMMMKNNLDHQEVFNVFWEDITKERKPVKRRWSSEKTYSFIDLFKTVQMATITINICFSWCVISMLYYGVTLNSVDMAGNRYVNFLLMILVEFPSHISAYYLFRFFDHRKPISFFMTFSGLNCIVSNFVAEGSFWFPLAMVILGKFGISAAFASIYLLSAEIFPTVVRGNGLGVASMFARFGSIFAPFILQLSSYVRWLPLSVYGLLSVVAGLLLLCLPETKHRDLPQTFDDLKAWKK
ncbi:organic cation transporter protein isoform X2 [Octopus bimaculoides]|uniref:Major facilitator superfamily (MFS) profile domain-containing protein n=2 Tax=Octopus bimaculoides TaxID=37653 RepID=A0A0L8FVM3_OCTBM|nr:organic cation transporter protein isoform X2 [Octopus bimaculoides]XP_014786503.1 organic cation transporter protein isoform X2 [Octopus bimaculoides]XP_014786504.1 organic cation transporter protein isoform X2 [Octopus bimaculoides]XP_052828493.1 organic cation transporter protein isoform X2 [Octopus bimaculoides]|eukprot:XP_014786502.1 PREDICTED: organic cation transporter protein-like [Octopus bimaculoides]